MGKRFLSLIATVSRTSNKQIITDPQGRYFATPEIMSTDFLKAKKGIRQIVFHRKTLHRTQFGLSQINKLGLAEMIS